MYDPKFRAKDKGLFQKNSEIWNQFHIIPALRADLAHATKNSVSRERIDLAVQASILLLYTLC
jgi:hypothetical protein